MKATPIDELRMPHPDQKQIDAEAVRLLLATAPAGYAKKAAKIALRGIILEEHSARDLRLPRS